jgi:hypothetical protein
MVRTQHANQALEENNGEKEKSDAEEQIRTQSQTAQNSSNPQDS